MADEPKSLEQLKAEGIAEAKEGVREMCVRLGLEADETERLVADVGVGALKFPRHHRPRHEDPTEIRPEGWVMPDVDARSTKAEREEARIDREVEKAKELEREKQAAARQSALEFEL